MLYGKFKESRGTKNLGCLPLEIKRNIYKKELKVKLEMYVFFENYEMKKRWRKKEHNSKTKIKTVMSALGQKMNKLGTIRMSLTLRFNMQYWLYCYINIYTVERELFNCDWAADRDCKIKRFELENEYFSVLYNIFWVRWRTQSINKIHKFIVFETWRIL